MKKKYFKRALKTLGLILPDDVKTYEDFNIFVESTETELEKFKNTLEGVKESLPISRKNLQILKGHIDTFKEFLETRI